MSLFDKLSNGDIENVALARDTFSISLFDRFVYTYLQIQELKASKSADGKTSAGMRVWVECSRRAIVATGGVKVSSAAVEGLAADKVAMSRPKSI